MASSVNKAFIRITAAQAAENDPCDAVIARDCIVNNAAHIADEAGQVRVAWIARDGEYISTGTHDVAYDFTHVVSYGPFPLSIRSDRTSYRMRIRLRGHYSGSSGDAYLVLSGDSDVTQAIQNVTGNAASFSVVSTTDGWVTPDGGSNTIYMSEAQVSAATGVISTLDAVGGSPYQAAICTAYVHVYASTGVATDQIRITGVEAAEFIGS